MNRDQQAQYVALIAAAQPRIYTYIRTLIPDERGVDDVLQETNLVLWRKIGDFQQNTNFNAWAYKIAYFQILAFYKKRKRQDWLCFDTELLEQLSSNIQRQSENFETELHKLRRCIEKLDIKQKQLLRERYYEGTPLRELAQKVQRSVNALKFAMYHIRDILRVCMRNNLTQEDS